MKTKRIMIAVSVFLAACVSIWIGAAAPQWIQYYERVVGENSPYYTDVVNRPAKQIWGNFTTQHTVNGAHKSSIFPTPIPTVPFPTPVATVTPSEGDNLFLVEHTITGTHLTSIFPTPIPTLAPVATVTPSAGDTFFLVEHQADGTHPSSIFPTPVPTLPYPTPAPTATPSLYFNWGDYVTIFSSSTIPVENCSGKPILFGGTSAATLTLPTSTDLNAVGYREFFLTAATNSSVVITITAGSGTYFVNPGGTAYTQIVSGTPPKGYVLYLRYIPGLNLWVVLVKNGTWTLS